MNPFQKRAAIRIAAVSVVLAAIASPVAWILARENSEKSIIAVATEESRGLIRHFNVGDLGGPQAAERANLAAQALSGGLFDIAEIYDVSGAKLAEAMTKDGGAVEPLLPDHGKPTYTVASYDSFELPGNRFVLRIFVPLHSAETGEGGPITGYFEGVRVVPAWEQDLIFASSRSVALMVGLASLLCGAALYPVVVHLSADNERKTQALLQAQVALIEGLQRSERELESQVSLRTLELQREQARTKELLHNILPVEIADELSATGSARPARHEAVSILFSDFIGFTQAVSSMPADRMVAELNEIVAAFDSITDDCGVEKIKTIGDAYMAAAGLPIACADHAQRCVRAGLLMIDYLEDRNKTAAFKWALRIGVHSGPVVAGVVGKRKYAFDIWGDTVNLASRMESAGEAGRVNISAYTYDLIRDQFECEYRSKIDAKGKGQLDMYFVKGLRHADA